MTGLLESFQKPEGQTSRFTYDALGYLQKDLGAGGDFSSFAGILNGSDATSMDLRLSTAEGRQSKYTLTRLPDGTYRREQTNPSGTVSVLEYKASDFEHSVNAGVDSLTKFAPDARFGTLVRLPLQTVVSAAGLKTQQIDVSQTLKGASGPFNFQSLTTTQISNGKTTTTQYDPRRHETRRTSPLGHQTLWVTDAWGKPVSTQNGTLTPTNFTYDQRGRLTTVTQDARRTEYSYGEDGGLESIRDATGNKTSFVYDSAENLSLQTLGDGQQIGYTYDRNGRVISVTPPGHSAHFLGFNLFELLAHYLAPLFGGGENARETTYAYNKDKQLTEVSLPSGDKIAYSYNSGGLLNQTTTTQGQYVYNYHPDGSPQMLTSPSGVKSKLEFFGTLPHSSATSFPDGLSTELAFAYDGALQVASITVGDSSVSYGYNDDSAPTQAGDETLTWKAETNALSEIQLGEVREAYAHDAQYGELISLNADYKNRLFYAESMVRDRLGRVQTRAEQYDAKPTQFTYTYDQAGRLTTVTRDGYAQSQYFYDGNGNRIGANVDGQAVSATYDEQDRLTKYGSASFSYDRNGRLSAREEQGQPTTYKYDSVGNLTDECAGLYG